MSPIPTRRVLHALGLAPMQPAAARAEEAGIPAAQAQVSQAFAALQREIDERTDHLRGQVRRADVLQREWRALCFRVPYLPEKRAAWERSEAELKHSSGYAAAQAEADQACQALCDVENRMVALPAVTLADIRLKAATGAIEEVVILEIWRDLGRMLGLGEDA